MEPLDTFLPLGVRQIESLPPGFARAAFHLFLVSEVHPFADGNGRVARVFMDSTDAEQTGSGWNCRDPTNGRARA